MKKLFFTLCALCLCGTMWAAVDQTYGLNYTLDEDNNATIIAPEDGVYSNSNLASYTSIEGAVTIPAEVDGYSVVAVGASAFASATISGTFVLPSYINTVGAGAFGSCTSLNTVIIEESDTPLVDQNTTASTQMFNGCSYITRVEMYRDFTISYGTGVVGGAFAYYDRIADIVIGEKVTTIPIYMFRSHYNTTATLNTVTSYAENPPELQTGAISNHATTPTLYTPYDYLNNYRLDADWGSIFDPVDHMHALGDEGDPDWPTDENAFQDENGLWYDPIEGTEYECVLIADQGGEVYEGTITIPETVVNSNDGNTYTVTRIDAGAFMNSNIEGAVVIPANILNMGTNAFENCTSITSVTYEYSPTALNEENTGNMTGGSFSGCSKITTVNLYRNITWTGTNQSGPFVGVSSVATLNIGPRVTSVPNYMFRCGSSTNSLATINCYAAVPPTLGTGPFGVVPSNCVANVPQGSQNTYGSSTWNTQYTSLTYNELSNAYAVDITLSNDEGYLATYYNSKGVDIYPEGGTTNDVSAYAATGVDVEEDSAYIVLEEVGATVAPSTAVLIDATASGTYTIIETTAANSAVAPTTNYLHGYDTATEIDLGDEYYYYTLSTYNGVLGFWWHESDGSAFTSAAHKAFLALDKNALDGINNIKLKKDGNDGDETTGISSIEVENEASTVKGIYTIQGIRVSNMNQPGLYIVDGKKVLVK